MAAEITQLLHAHRSGDASALDRLASTLYPELKAMARRRAEPSMGATTLVNETFLRLLSGGGLNPDDRHEFFALAATIMRRIIVDEVRYLTASKRERVDVTLAETIIGDESQEKIIFLLQVDEILTELEKRDARLARVFECRYFAGLTISETSDALGIPPRSVERLWSDARARIAALIEDSNS